VSKSDYIFIPYMSDCTGKLERSAAGWPAIVFKKDPCNDVEKPPGPQLNKHIKIKDKDNMFVEAGFLPYYPTICRR